MALGFASVGAPAATGLAAEPGFIVVANPRVAADTLSLEELGRIYRKDVTRWPDGSDIVPVELGGTSTIRETFYMKTLKMMIGDVTAYWINQAMTTGSHPPKVFSSSSLVMHFVAQTPGAVGFVDPDAALDPQVKRIAVH